MYQIQDYKKRAVETVIPYLINFPQIISIIEQSADRYQAIEDVLWQFAQNLKVDDARGVFLQALAHNEVTNIVYTDVADDAFTYGTTKPESQAFGTGHYYSQASYLSGIKKDVTDEKTIRAVKAKIIQNNTNCTIEDFIEGLKLYYNADSINVYESNPLNVSVMLKGGNLEVSSSGNRDIIKSFLPACVALKNIYLDQNEFDVFKYGEPAYGDSRYPVLVGDTVDTYNYISHSIDLNSKNKEYLTTHYNTFKDGLYCCIVGEFKQLTAGGALVSSCDVSTGKGISLIVDDNNHFGLKYDDTIYPTDITASTDKRYTIIVSRTKDKINLWITPSVQIYGNNLEQDNSYINSKIQYNTPDLTVENYTETKAPLTINCKNGGSIQADFSDFIYYAIVLGENGADKPNEYHTTCYGEKQIVFNCLENTHHLWVHTQDSLVSNILTRQSYYNYKSNHSHGRYMYLDGKSGINYNILNSNLSCTVQSFDISFETCTPLEISTGNILTDFVSTNTGQSKICFSSTGELIIDIPTVEHQGVDDIDTSTEVLQRFTTPTDTIKADEYAKFKIEYKNPSLKVYKNDTLILETSIIATVNNVPSVLRLGYDKDITSPYKGFIKNLQINIIGVDADKNEHNIKINLSYQKCLQDDDKAYTYTNYGARFITVPQIIDNTDGTDIYNNTLVSKR